MNIISKNNIYLQDIVKKGYQLLKKANIDNAKQEMYWFIKDKLSISSEKQILENIILNKFQINLVENFLKRRISGEPYQYIINKVSVYGYDFLINKHTLIPRPETELIIEVVKKTGTYNSCLDVGTGSGNIAITLVKEKLVKKVDAIDISKDALKVAHKNCKKHQINNICFYNVDFFNFTLNTKYDLVVSNPPYISLEDYVALDRQIKFYEPKIALTDGEQGLSFYRFFAKKLKQILKPKGQLVFEIGLENTQETINDLFIKEGYKCNWEKDLNGDYRVCRVYK